MEMIDSMITSIKFVGIPVSDQERALRFYTDVLGFTVTTDQPMGGSLRWIELRIGNSSTGIALFTPDGHEDRVGTFQNLSMQCDDVERTYSDLKARGADFERPPQKESWGTSAILRDSEGNRLVLSSR
jgi:predicted enzyme related to lactoylglutathione lyase